MFDFMSKAAAAFPPPLPPVMILAGGQGTRLRSMVPDVPKVLADVAGRPFLSWWFATLAAQGVRRVTLCTGFKSDQISTAFGRSWGPIELDYSRETIPLGTGGAVALGARRFREDWVLVMNGDSFCEVDLRQLWQRHLQRNAFATVAVVSVPDTRRFGWVNLRPDGRITGFREKHSTRGDGWINAGVYLLPRATVAALRCDAFSSLERDVLPSWCSLGLHGESRTGRFIDIGTPDSYLEAQSFFATAGTGI